MATLLRMGTTGAHVVKSSYKPKMINNFANVSTVPQYSNMRVVLPLQVQQYAPISTTPMLLGKKDPKCETPLDKCKKKLKKCEKAVKEMKLELQCAKLAAKKSKKSKKGKKGKKSKKSKKSRRSHESH